MWGVLVEHAAAQSDADVDARVALIEAEAKGSVNQTLLDRLTGILGRGARRKVVPRVIPFGRTDDEQRDILEAISNAVGRGEVSFDLQLKVRSLWYGALDMSEGEVTPVLRLDGLNAIEHWLAALDRFDASGD
jgi:hypothetical protein